MGCELSDHQADLLVQGAETIVVFDGNDAGRKGAQRAVQKLEGRTKVRLVQLPDGYEPEDVEPRGLRWLVNGMRALDLSEVQFSVCKPQPDNDKEDDE